MIEILVNSRYKDNELDKHIMPKRFDREDFWIKALRGFYPNKLM